MKGREDMPMRAIEERVRDAFGAAAETVTARDLPGVPAPAGRSRAARGPRAWAPRARSRALVPVAAAAGVAVIAVTTALVVPALLAGPPGGPAAALAGAPRFFAGVTPNPRGQVSTELNVYRSATGRVVASVPLPGRDHAFAAVARLGGDQAYVAAAVTSFRACTTRLYRFTIDARGRPAPLTPLSVPRVTGTVAELAGSADGNVLAYTAAGRCAPRGRALAGVIHLATGQVTTWTHPATAGSLSLTADGSVLGFTAGPSDVWVLPTSAPAGPLTRHARKVLHLRTGVFRAVLTSTGSGVYAETGTAPREAAAVLGLYSTTTGRRIRLVGRISTTPPRSASRPQPPSTRQPAPPTAAPITPGFAELSVTMDAAGRHLLIYGYPGFRGVTAMNLTSGHQASITTAQPPVTDSAFTTAAW
jgi:hypothetical protein